MTSRDDCGLLMPHAYAIQNGFAFAFVVRSTGNPGDEHLGFRLSRAWLSFFFLGMNLSLCFRILVFSLAPHSLSSTTTSSL